MSFGQPALEATIVCENTGGGNPTVEFQEPEKLLRTLRQRQSAGFDESEADPQKTEKEAIVDMLIASKV